MNLYDLPIPGLKNFKTIVGSYTQMICGLLVAVVALLNGVIDCLGGVSPLDVCLNRLPMLFLGVMAAANGLANLGLGHKLLLLKEKLSGSEAK